MQSLQVRPSCKACLWCQNPPKLSHFVLKAQASSAEDKRDAIAERIRKAREYREPIKGDVQPPVQRTGIKQPAIEQPMHSSKDVPDKLMVLGDHQASQQTEQLLAAVQELQQVPEAATPGPPDPSMQASDQPQSKPSETKQAAPGKTLSKADMQAKISQAKAYKQEKEAKPNTAPEIAPIQQVVVATQPDQAQDTTHKAKDSFSATQRQPVQRQEESQADEPTAEPRVENEGIGSATQAAGFLQQAVKGKDASKGMRMETYSVLKEQELRKQKVEIISVDKNYSTDKKVMDPSYSPKVATWGVFERPANISETYGGGRTIKAGTPLEDAAATQARKERIAAALSRFKRDAGTLVEPAVQQACVDAFNEGEQLFKDKLVAAALSKYAVAAELMPLKTDLGGRARLQKAICLDSLGQNKEAFAVYSLIERHPTAEVAKVAKRMIFGFRAMDNLKAHTISYSVTKGAYDKYFNSLSGDWNAAYVASNDEDSTELTKVIIIASMVMLAPLVFLAVKILL